MAPFPLLRACVLSCSLLSATVSFAQTPKPAEAPAATEDEAPSIKGPANKPAIPVQRTKGSAGTLIFNQGTPTSLGGQFTQVIATALPATAGTPSDLCYERFLGPMTMKSLDQVMRSTLAMQHGWPQGQKLQLTFSARPTPSELTPSTLAAGLALDSMLRNYDIDPTYAAIGSLQEDGTVDAVGAIPERLAGAGRARVARIVVPEKNYEQVSDYLLSGGIGSFVGTQIFTAKDFNEAGMLAVTKLDPKLQEVLTLFSSLQKTLSFSQSNVAILKTEGTQALLRRVLEVAPNHASARILLDWGTAKKAVMTFDGSVDTIDRRAANLIKAMRATPQEAVKTPRDVAMQDLAGLRFVADRLDPRARMYAAGLAKFGDALQKNLGVGRTAPKLTPAALAAVTAAQQAGNDEWTKLVKMRQEIAEKKQAEKEEAK